MGIKVEDLIRSLLKPLKVSLLDVNSRVKTLESATKKIDGSGGKYETFGDLHDMLGVRVITYLQSDVEAVVAALRADFDVDDSRSSSKASMLDPTQFGYLSEHLVVRVHESRAGLVEWVPYANQYFEIQIRSVLQHAWAEIEHDLGYKSATGIPTHLKRRFARLAGLLETADVEFDALSAEAESYAEGVRATIESGGAVDVDQDSIAALISTQGVVRTVDLAIAEGIGAELEPSASRSYAGSRAEELVRVGLVSTEMVEHALSLDSEKLVRFAVAWLTGSPERIASRREDDFPEDLPSNMDAEGNFKTLSPGVSLFYLYLHEQMKSSDPQEALHHVANMDDPGFFGHFADVHTKAFG